MAVWCLDRARDFLGLDPETRRRLAAASYDYLLHRQGMRTEAVAIVLGVEGGLSVADRLRTRQYGSLLIRVAYGESYTWARAVYPVSEDTAVTDSVVAEQVSRLQRLVVAPCDAGAIVLSKGRVEVVRRSAVVVGDAGLPFPACVGSAEAVSAAFTYLRGIPCTGWTYIPGGIFDAGGWAFVLKEILPELPAEG